MDEDMIKKVVDIAHDTKEIAKNAIEPASKNIGGALGTFTGFFANVVLYPLKCLNSKFEQKAIAFERKMQEKYNNIPEENRTNAPVNILGPMLESLKYNVDEEYLQNLYANLLATSMDKTKQQKVHPKYVATISSMNETDAKVFKYLYNKYKRQFILAGRVHVHILGTNQNRHCLPEWTIPDNIENYSIFEISRSLIRLNNLGMLTLNFNYNAGRSILSELYKLPEINAIFQYQKILGYNVELTGTDCVIFINDDGANFAQIVFEG